MEITAIKGDILNTTAELVVVGLYQEEDWSNDFVLMLNDIVRGKLKKKVEATDFKAMPGESLTFSAGSEASCDYVLVVGLGPEGALKTSEIRQVAGSVFAAAKRLSVKTVAMELLGEDDSAFENKANGRDARKAERGIEEAETVVDGVTVARDLVNTPAQDMNPERLAEAAEEIARLSDGRIRTRVYDRDWCTSKGMGAYLSVTQGSDSEPKFIHLTYKPSGKPKKVVALVGKGVTFDSGGLSLKPGKSMETMKCDMAGAAAVLGTFATLARIQPRVEVHGIIAATENMPSGKAIRPGDIVRAMNGKTIEILNTDAEGRLTLADALGYAQKQKPDYVVDLATLTGACVVALGEEISALMANDEVLAQDLLTAASNAGEELWQMPLYPAYNKLIESSVADLRNIATSSYGGSLTAGLFLQNFIEEGQVWAHMDIAGPAFAERPIGTYLGTGGTGYGVRTLTTWLSRL